MDLVDFLELDPNKEYEVHYDGEFIWKHTHFQYKRKNNIGYEKLDSNSLPLLDEKYIVGDAGEPLLNDNDEAVFDPTQEIGEERYLGIGFKQIYKSKTFVPLLQKKIKELIDSGRLSFIDDAYLLHRLAVKAIHSPAQRFFLLMNGKFIWKIWVADLVGVF